MLEAGENDPGKGKSTRESQFIAVDGVAGSVYPVAGLPFVRPAKRYSQHFASFEKIPAGKADYGTRTCLIIAFRGNIQFKFSVQRKFIHGIYTQVQRIAG